MKKTPLFLLAASLLTGLLTGCTGGDSNDNSSQESDTFTSQPVDTDTSVEAPIDFTVQTSCVSGSFDQDAYTFATVAEDDKPWPGFWNPEIRVMINHDNWAHVTALFTSRTVIQSQNEDVLPVSAITVKEEVSSNSGLLESVLLTIDRAALTVGTSHLKVHLENQNGAQSATPIDLCVPVEVKEYGTLEAPAVKATFSLDLRGLEDKYEGLPANFCVQDDDHVYGHPHKTVTEYPITGKEVTVENVDLPLNHSLYFFVRFELENGRLESKRLALESDSSFEERPSGIYFESAPSGTINATLA